MLIFTSAQEELWFHFEPVLADSFKFTIDDSTSDMMLIEELILTTEGDDVMMYPNGYKCVTLHVY